MVNNCIYKYTCTCKQVYIGETLRRLDIRVSEHARNTEKSRSPMMIHINECGSVFDRGKFTVVARALEVICRGKNMKQCLLNIIRNLILA